MVFEYDFTIPANTPASAKVRLDMKLARGIVHQLSISFPAGCRGQVFLAINRALHQVWPTNPDGQFKGEFFPIQGAVYEPLEEPPYTLEAYGWSPGTAFDHTATIRLWLLPREVLEPGRQAVGVLERLGGLLFGTKK